MLDSVELRITVKCPRCRRPGRVKLLVFETETKVQIVHDDGTVCVVENPDPNLLREIIQGILKLYKEALELLSRCRVESLQ